MGDTGRLTIQKTGDETYQLDFTTPDYDANADPTTEPLFFYSAYLAASEVTLGYRNVANEVVTPGTDHIAIVGFGGIAARFDVTGLQYLAVELGDPTVWPGIPGTHPNVDSFDVYYIPLSGEVKVVVEGVSAFASSIAAIETDPIQVVVAGFTGIALLGLIAYMAKSAMKA